MTKNDYYSCFRGSNATSLSTETKRNLDCLTALLWAAEERLYGDEYTDDNERVKLETLLCILDKSIDVLDEVNDLA